jgi:hypothetical protein
VNPKTGLDAVLVVDLVNTDERIVGACVSRGARDHDLLDEL